MARLIVEVVSSKAFAAPGNNQPVFILTSVTDANGVPVTGLTKANAKVHAMVVAAGGAEVIIKTFFEPVGGTTLPGYYRIEVAPVGSNKWLNGVYVIAVAIAKGADKGQTLTSVLIG